MDVGKSEANAFVVVENSCIWIDRLLYDNLAHDGGKGKENLPGLSQQGNLSGFPERPRRLAISSYPVAQARYRDCRP